MNPAQLLAHFNRLADTLDAVPRLRRFVLDLAFNETRAREDSEPPWRMVKLEEVAAEITPGFACSKAHQRDDGYVHLRTHNVAVDGRLNFDLMVRVDPTKIDSAKARLRRGDVLFNNTNSQELVGKTCLVDQDYDYAFSNHLTRIRLVDSMLPSFLVKYFNLLLQCGVFAKTCVRWIGQAGINTTVLRRIEVPLPPLAEQRRIVARVDELIALCDRLEAAQAEREGRRDRLVRASLGRLNQPTDDAAAFRDHVRFALDHLPRLATRPEHVILLRQTILNLAIRGKLVPQDPNDEPATGLLKRIASEKVRLLKDGRGRAVSPMNPDDGPFQIPRGWVWVRFGEIVFSRDGERVPVSKEVRSGLAKNYDYYGASGVIDKIDKYLFDKPLLLIGEDGANLINRSTPIAFIARGKYWVNNHAHVLDGISEDFLRYLELHINAIDLKPYVTGTAQPKMNQAKMNSIPIALPPEAEQRRIVAKVDELMALCDRLEVQLAAAGTGRARLIESVLHHALRGEGATGS